MGDKCGLKPDMYGFQIESVNYVEDAPQLQGDPKDEVRLRAFILNQDGSMTQNPDYDNEPYLVTIYGIRKVGKLVSSTPKGRVKTNAFKVLAALGLEPSEEAKFDSIDWQGLRGMYGRGFIELSQDEKWPRLPIGNIKPLSSEDQIKSNLSKRGEVFIKK